MMKLLLLSVIAVSLVGCATGSELLTDQVYPAIADPTDVSILVEMPEEAEQIAFLKASSAWGPGQRLRLEKVVEVLKRRAAKLGANSIVLTGQDYDTTALFIAHGGLGYRERLEGIAIFVR